MGNKTSTSATDARAKAEAKAKEVFAYFDKNREQLKKFSTDENDATFIIAMAEEIAFELAWANLSNIENAHVEKTDDYDVLSLPSTAPGTPRTGGKRKKQTRRRKMLGGINREELKAELEAQGLEPVQVQLVLDLFEKQGGTEPIAGVSLATLSRTVAEATEQAEDKHATVAEKVKTSFKILIVKTKDVVFSPKFKALVTLSASAAVIGFIIYKLDPVNTMDDYCKLSNLVDLPYGSMRMKMCTNAQEAIAKYNHWRSAQGPFTAILSSVVDSVGAGLSKAADDAFKRAIDTVAPYAQATVVGAAGAATKKAYDAIKTLLGSDTAVPEPTTKVVAKAVVKGSAQGRKKATPPPAQDSEEEKEEEEDATEEEAAAEAVEAAATDDGVKTAAGRAKTAAARRKRYGGKRNKKGGCKDCGGKKKKKAAAAPKKKKAAAPKKKTTAPAKKKATTSKK